jgi:hypothetical protein
MEEVSRIEGILSLTQGGPVQHLLHNRPEQQRKHFPLKNALSSVVAQAATAVDATSPVLSRFTFVILNLVTAVLLQKEEVPTPEEVKTSSLSQNINFPPHLTFIPLSSLDH